MNENQLPMTLRKLRLDDGAAFEDAYREFKSADDFEFLSHYQEGMRFHHLLQRLDELEKGINIPQGYVPSTFLFGFKGEKIVGRVMIRHELNDFLRNIGGHIGYGVVPSERRKGYATQILLQSLPFARSIGLEQVLVTCDETNIASRKVIERAGGVFERKFSQGKGLPDKLLYWIRTES